VVALYVFRSASEPIVYAPISVLAIPAP